MNDILLKLRCLLLLLLPSFNSILRRTTEPLENCLHHLREPEVIQEVKNQVRAHIRDNQPSRHAAGRVLLEPGDFGVGTSTGLVDTHAAIAGWIEDESVDADGF